MSFIQRIIEALDARLWKFVRLVHNANHDYPYHDYIKINNTEGQDSINATYAVGSTNKDAHGDQSKLFVSKRMIICTDDEEAYVVFNDTRNVPIYLQFKFVDATGAMFWYEQEFHANINVVYYCVRAGHILSIYCEGVLPEETRDAE